MDECSDSSVRHNANSACAELHPMTRALILASDASLVYHTIFVGPIRLRPNDIS
jgi:hypothetical protein